MSDQTKLAIEWALYIAGIASALIQALNSDRRKDSIYQTTMTVGTFGFISAGRFFSYNPNVIDIGLFVVFLFALLILIVENIRDKDHKPGKQD